MHSEEELLPLSGLHHIAFCQRRWALVHIESIRQENRFTAEGNLLHERAHSGEMESRPGALIRRTVPIHSFRLGLLGQADVVEFQPVDREAPGVALPGRHGLWRPYPIEYKRSRDQAGSVAYRIQLCAQAMCLEEMLSVRVPEGAVFDGARKRRQPVEFDARMREMVEAFANRMHELFRKRETPAPAVTKACSHCSLREMCCPEVLSSHGSVWGYYREYLREDTH